jgi:hypothetical protein
MPGNRPVAVNLHARWHVLGDYIRNVQLISSGTGSDSLARGPGNAMRDHTGCHRPALGLSRPWLQQAFNNQHVPVSRMEARSAGCTAWEWLLAITVLAAGFAAGLEAPDTPAGWLLSTCLSSQGAVMFVQSYRSAQVPWCLVCWHASFAPDGFSAQHSTTTRPGDRQRRRAARVYGWISVCACFAHCNDSVRCARRYEVVAIVISVSLCRSWTLHH